MSFTFLPTFTNPSSPGVMSNCPMGSLLCASGECLQASEHCDGKLDCRDGSDEDNCSGIYYPKATSRARWNILLFKGVCLNHSYARSERSRYKLIACTIAVDSTQLQIEACNSTARQKAKWCTNQTCTQTQCLKNRAEGDILCWAYAFLDMLVLALKSFFAFKYTSCLALT